MCERLPNIGQEGCISVLASGPNPQASLAAEWLGHFGDPEVVQEPLIKAIMHESPLVREGVALGIEALLNRVRSGNDAS